MEIIQGRLEQAQKVVIYGPEGIGKSTFAAEFPQPLFIDTEGSTAHLNVRRLPKPESWEKLLEEVRYTGNNPGICKTLVIDTADWAERLCAAEVCARAKHSGIEDFGYGKGYVYLKEEFAKLLELLEKLKDTGINVVITAHAQMRKFEQPEETGAYDRWEMKLTKHVAPLVKEWADAVLFANFKTIVTNIDGKGAAKGKNKAQGNARVMYAAHHACWDAKNRWGLADELPLDYKQIARHIPGEGKEPAAPAGKEEVTKAVAELAEETAAAIADEEKREGDPLRELAVLMDENKVAETEIRSAVAYKGYYPEDTPIRNYAPEFVSGVLVGAWPQVFGIIKEMRTDMPF